MFAVLQTVNTSDPRVWIPNAWLIAAVMWCKVYFAKDRVSCTLLRLQIVFFPTEDIIAATVNTSAL